MRLRNKERKREKETERNRGNRETQRTREQRECPAQVQAHFIPSGTRLAQVYIFLHDPNSSPHRERPMHSGPQGKSDLCVQRADWKSDPRHCKCAIKTLTEHVSLSNPHHEPQLAGVCNLFLTMRQLEFAIARKACPRTSPSLAATGGNYTRRRSSRTAHPRSA